MSELFIISSQQQKGFFNTFSKNIYLIVASPTLHWHYNFFPELRIKPFVQSKSDFNFTLNNIHIIF